MKKCEHESSSIEYVREIDYDCMDHIDILVKDVCNQCGKELGREIHRFKYAYNYEIAKEE